MKNLPPLTTVMKKGPESGFEFERLMKILLIHDGSLKGYVFEPGVTYRDRGIDGIVKKKYPGMDCPVVFQFKWLEGPINEKDAGRQIISSFESLLASDVEFKTYVLVTPQDLTGAEKKWLDEFPSKYNRKFDIYHWGHLQFLDLLDEYPTLKKEYYGESVEGVFHNFNVLEEKYRKAIIEEVKFLHFIGMPTGSYQKQQLLEKPELAKVYIPLEFSKKYALETVTLDKIKEESRRVVVLGDPGSGKSTLAKYLALIHSQDLGEERKPGIEGKIPFIIPIREFVRYQQERKEVFNFIDYLKYISEANYHIENMDRDFFIARLTLGNAIVLFDGLDEVASESGRTRVAKNIQQFALQYPDSPVWVTSRIVGYTVNVKLDSKEFDHYYLAPVKPDQAKEFIEKWYEIQVPRNKTHRDEKIRALKSAIDNNPGVQRLKTNPLLLTMMTLVHQFEGTLPDDRAKLYDKCIELFIKTWQEQKYIELAIKNPLEERGLKYDDQLRMLAAAAFYIQDKSMDRKYYDSRGLIAEKELEKVLFDTRFDKKRMNEENAREDIKIFLDYIRDKAGLLVEKGRDKNGENVFAFVHLSFLEYLCAYQVAEDKSKAQKDHIEFLLQYLGKPAWEEPILLSLYLFAKSTGQKSFVDAFSEAVFERLDAEPNPNGWFLMGRAVRDNIGFACADIKRISEEIVEIWFKGNKRDIAFSILNEIVRFSKDGKNLLKEVIKESIKNNPAEKAFESLCLYNRLYEIDSLLLEIISNSKDYIDLMPYLPVFRNNRTLAGYIDKELKESQCVVYFNSVPDKTTDNLEKLTAGPFNPVEIRGFVLGSWSGIFSAFQRRNRFIDINKKIKRIPGKICCDFGGFAAVSRPFTLFKPYTEISRDIFSPSITNKLFLTEDERNDRPVNEKPLSCWLSQIMLNSFGTRENRLSPDKRITQPEKDLLIKKIANLSRDLSRNLSRDFSRGLSRDLSRDCSGGVLRDFTRTVSEDFSKDLSQYFRRDFNRDFSHYFDRYFSRDSSRYFIGDFSRDFRRYFSRDLSRYFIRDFSRDFSRYFSRDRNRDFIKLISNLYRKKYNEKLDWNKLSGDNDEKLYLLYVDEFENENWQFIDPFFNYLYIFLFWGKFEIIFASFGTIVQSLPGKQTSAGMPASPFISITNPLVIPFTFYFIFISALHYYFLNLMSGLNITFHNKKEISDSMIFKAIDNFTRKNPFDLNFINFSWDFYAQAFNETYWNREENDAKRLALAAFVVNAVKVSMAAGLTPEGDHWNKTLEEAEKSDHPFVQISLTLYKLCNFQDREINSRRLKTQLESFKTNYPDFYKLIGFKDKS